MSSTNSNPTVRAGLAETTLRRAAAPPGPLNNVDGIEWVSAGDVMALVVRHTCEPDATTFVTSPPLPMQLGFVVYPEGTAIAAHRHSATPRAVTGTPEFLLVRRGRCRVTFHPGGREETQTVDLVAGDCLMILQGAHSLDFDEDTVLLEVKQGPFLGPGEKELL